MIKIRKASYIIFIIIGIFFLFSSLQSNSMSFKRASEFNVTINTQHNTQLLSDSISAIAAGAPGEVGVALIVNNTDTIVVNNRSVYPMMSVFKLHQGLAICDDFDRRGISLDSVVTIDRTELDPDTWSPMLKDHPDSSISLTVRDLLKYTLISSDNNASNFMFKNLVSVDRTDKFIAKIIPRNSFKIAFSEEEMKADHDKAYENYTSPLGAASLMNRLFADSLLNSSKQSFIIKTLKQCSTGKDRIAAPLLDRQGIVIAHKTGSGYRDANGVLAAHNDVAHIVTPEGISYTLAVFVKDFKGNEEEASKVIAKISATIYSLLTKKQNH